MSEGPGRVPYIDLGAEHRAIKAELLQAVERVFDDAQFILGPPVAELERAFAVLAGTRHAVAVGNGTDAITLTLRALGVGPGDEVVTAPNSFLASASAIVLAGARPVFADTADDYNIDPGRIAEVISPRTRAILPVHLTGRPARMDEILAIARKRGLHVVEDCAQAVGASLGGKAVGGFGVAGCFSLHPVKNLAACGDGGMITTDDDALASMLRKARNHGLANRDDCLFFSPNSRLDTLQAAIVLAKVPRLAAWTERRRATAAFYRESLADVVRVPVERDGERGVYHTFVVQTPARDELAEYLKREDVETRIHYPVPIHLQPAAKELGYRPGDFPVAERQARECLSLPVFPGLEEGQKARVVEAVRGFFDQRGGSRP